MGIYRGPNPINDGLVFGYDNGYNSDGEQIASGRFFKGPAHTNLVEEIDPSYTNTNVTHFKAISGEEVVDIPIVGKRTVKYVNYFNNRYASDGSVNSGTTCCPNLFHYHVGNAPYIAVDSSSNYTYSIIYKHTGGYHHPNFMYHYQKNSSNTTLTEGGVSSTSSDRRTHLGNGWYHAWGNIATQSTCTNVLLYSFLYNYGVVEHKYYVAAVSFVKNTTGETYLKIPPQLMLEPLGSVSNTASLIDLKKTTDIDVSNVSFDSTGQPTFDGSNDYITIPGSSGITSDAKTVEIMFKMNGSYPNFSPLAIYANSSSSTNRIWLGLQNNKFRMHGWGTVDPEGTTTISADEWYVCTFSYDKSTQAMKVYTNGVLETSTTNTQSGVTASSSLNWYLGTVPGGWQSVTYSDVDIPIFKLYNRILSDSEVKQNYNAYKNRFDI